MANSDVVNLVIIFIYIRIFGDSSSLSAQRNMAVILSGEHKYKKEKGESPVTDFQVERDSIPESRYHMLDACVRVV